MEKIIVMAGTSVDTQMGVDVIEASGNEAIFCPLSSSPIEQTAFQFSDEETKQKKIIDLLKKYENESKKLFVYCNSLGASLDFKAVSKDTGVQIVTPLDVYAQIAKSHKYHKLAMIAANPPSTYGISKLMFEIDNSLSIVEISSLDIVYAIEAKQDPIEIIRCFQLVELINWFEATNCDALLLACTHFPYVLGPLLEKVTLPVIDPADEMLKMLGL